MPLNPSSFTTPPPACPASMFFDLYPHGLRTPSHIRNLPPSIGAGCCGSCLFLAAGAPVPPAQRRQRARTLTLMPAPGLLNRLPLWCWWLGALVEGAALEPKPASTAAACARKQGLRHA